MTILAEQTSQIDAKPRAAGGSQPLAAAAPAAPPKTRCPLSARCWSNKMPGAWHGYQEITILHPYLLEELMVPNTLTGPIEDRLLRVAVAYEAVSCGRDWTELTDDQLDQWQRMADRTSTTPQQRALCAWWRDNGTEVPRAEWPVIVHRARKLTESP